MSRPIGPEGDLNGIVGQVKNLREQRGVAGQTDAEYRETITNYANGLLTLASQPDVQAILTTERNKRIYTRARYESLFPPKLGSLMGDKYNNWSFVTDRRYIGRREMIDQYPLSLDAREISNGKFNFTLEFEASNPEDKISLDFLGPWRDKRRRDGRPQIIPTHPIFKDSRELIRKLELPGALEHGMNIVSHFQAALGIDRNGWMYEQRYDPTFDFNRTFLIKQATIEDFLRHPEWLKTFKDSLNHHIATVQKTTNSFIHERQEKIKTFSGVPIEQIISDLRTHTGEYSPVDLFIAAQNAASTALEQTSPLPSGVSEERVRAIVAEMITERLATIQLTREREIVYVLTPQIEATVHEIAQGNAAAENIMQRFVRRSKDPQKITQALLELSALIPGSSQISAILKAVNTMFGPEETTR